MESKSEIQLAIKYSTWAPAKWIHTTAKVGDKLSVRVGGDFFYDPLADEKIPNIIFIAGGVGVNPLFSILQHLSSLNCQNSTMFSGRVTLLYSAGRKEDILFQVSSINLFVIFPFIIFHSFLLQIYIFET